MSILRTTGQNPLQLPRKLQNLLEWQALEKNHPEVLSQSPKRRRYAMPATSSPIVTTNPQQTIAPLWHSAPPQEVASDLLLHKSFVNTYALRTEVGLLLIDPGFTQNAQSVYNAVRAWSQAPLHTVVYTQGHVDHAFGLRAFLETGERPQIIAQENCPKRFQRYRLTHGLNTAINRRQFGNPTYVFPEQFDWPTLTFRDTLVQRLGNL